MNENEKDELILQLQEELEDAIDKISELKGEIEDLEWDQDEIEDLESSVRRLESDLEDSERRVSELEEDPCAGFSDSQDAIPFLARAIDNLQYHHTFTVERLLNKLESDNRPLYLEVLEYLRNK